MRTRGFMTAMMVLAAISVAVPTGCATTQKSNVAALTGDAETEKSGKKLELHKNARGHRTYKPAADK